VLYKLKLFTTVRGDLVVFWRLSRNKALFEDGV
jgi:hypothetical protein